jgi:hypothetical protein
MDRRGLSTIDPSAGETGAQAAASAFAIFAIFVAAADRLQRCWSLSQQRDLVWQWTCDSTGPRHTSSLTTGPVGRTLAALNNHGRGSRSTER